LLSRPPVKPVEDKLRIVRAVLRGEVSMKEAARRERVSETSIAWRDQFLDGGRAALAGGARHGPSTREAELQAQIDELLMADRGDYWPIGSVIAKGEFPRLRAAGLDSLREVIVDLVPWLAESIHHLADWKQVSLLSVACDTLPKWWRPGLLMIGDAAHVMSPVAGNGINYAVQDAVAAANLLAEPLAAATSPTPTWRPSNAGGSGRPASRKPSWGRSRTEPSPECCARAPAPPTHGWSGR
jgi:hypothetical protein